MGKGYLNLTPNDHHVHALSARGISTVPKVDLQKYQGRWYNVASIPAWFDQGLKNQKAKYTIRKDGKVDVLNSGELMGRMQYATAVARPIDKTNARLKVSFFPFIEGDYDILYLDKRYSYAVVGEPSREYLWFLSRKPKISMMKYNELLKVARKNGYDVSKLQNQKVTTLNAMKLESPTIELLASKDYDRKFKDEYAPNEYGYAITRIKPDGEVNISVRDDGDIDRDGRLIMHELKEIEIYRDLVDNKGVSPQIADKLAHNLNPVKVSGVSDQYPI